MAAEDLAGWLLDLVRCYAWSGAMPGPVLCLVRCYAWSGAMPGPVLPGSGAAGFRCYAKMRRAGHRGIKIGRQALKNGPHPRIIGRSESSLSRC